MRQAFSGMLWSKQFYYYDVAAGSTVIPPSRHRRPHAAVAGTPGGVTSTRSTSCPCRTSGSTPGSLPGTSRSIAWLVLPDGTAVPLKVRSMVAMIPMLAVAVIDEDMLARSVTVGKRFADLMGRQGRDDRDKMRQLGVLRGDPGRQRLLVSIVGMDRLEKLFARLFDEKEFLSPYGLRALSAYHRDHPYTLNIDGYAATIDYEPASAPPTRPVGRAWSPISSGAVTATCRLGNLIHRSLTVNSALTIRAVQLGCFYRPARATVGIGYPERTASRIALTASEADPGRRLLPAEPPGHSRRGGVWGEESDWVIPSM
jgi:hypothetical protein